MSYDKEGFITTFPEHIIKDYPTSPGSDAPSEGFLELVINEYPPEVSGDVIRMLFVDWPEFCRNEYIETFPCTHPLVYEFVLENIGVDEDPEIINLYNENDSKTYIFRSNVKGLWWMCTYYESDGENIVLTNRSVLRLKVS